VNASVGAVKWEQVAHLGDAALHNQKVGVVDIELDALEKSLDIMLLGLVSIQEVFRNIW
jgi:hypothetical protein